MTPLLSVERLVGGYGAADEILKGIDLVLPERRMAAIVGPNGAGKATLLKAVAGLLPIREGEIRFEGERIDGLRPDQILRASPSCRRSAPSSRA